jgi:hypothetical protein
MGEYRRRGEEGKCVFVGVDLHRFKWHVSLGGFAPLVRSVPGLFDSCGVWGGLFWFLAL